MIDCPGRPGEPAPRASVFAYAKELFDVLMPRAMGATALSVVFAAGAVAPAGAAGTSTDRTPHHSRHHAGAVSEVNPACTALATQLESQLTNIGAGLFAPPSDKSIGTGPIGPIGQLLGDVNALQSAGCLPAVPPNGTDTSPTACEPDVAKLLADIFAQYADLTAATPNMSGAIKVQSRLVSDVRGLVKAKCLPVESPSNAPEPPTGPVTKPDLPVPVTALPAPALPTPALPVPALPAPGLPAPALPVPVLPTPVPPVPTLPTPALPTSPVAPTMPDPNVPDPAIPVPVLPIPVPALPDPGLPVPAPVPPTPTPALPTPVLPTPALPVPSVPVPVPSVPVPVPTVPKVPLPSAPAVPALPTIPAPPTVPVQPIVPALPSVPSLPSAPALPTIPSLPNAPILPSVTALPAAPTAPTAPTLPAKN